jgi:hypothetical protein
LSFELKRIKVDKAAETDVSSQDKVAVKRKKLLTHVKDVDTRTHTGN